MNSSSSMGKHASGNVSSTSTGLADRKAGERVQSVLHLPCFGIQVDADEIEVVYQFLRHEPGGQPLPIQAPVHEADRNNVALVPLPDGSSQVANPLASDVGPGPISLVQRDE